MSRILVKAINKTTNIRFLWLVNIVLIIIFSILLAFYLIQVSIMAEGNTLFGHYQEKIDEICRENKNLEITFSQKSSLKNFENLLEELDFEKVAKVDYIRVLETSMAAR